MPGNADVEKNYRDNDREELLRRIRELEIELRKTKMARDAYDKMIRLAEQYYNIPIRKKSGAKYLRACRRRTVLVATIP